MRKIAMIIFILVCKLAAYSQQYPYPMPAYTPSADNIVNRSEFQDMKFGLFIHWGIYSEMANGEWIMHNNNIPYTNYKRLAGFFDPQKFSAKEWVAMAKAAGMKYITITARHHDGFSMFKTNASDYNIVDATPYGKDPIKELAEECQKEGIHLHLYYSLLDWGRTDYGFGKPVMNGAPVNTDWNSYISFMKQQLTELLTNYPNVDAIWFDGEWEKRTANWHFDEIYQLIHRIRPKALVGNNHHLKPLPGEDFQMFEKDLPGGNTSGFSKDASISELPLETCETMNNGWGFTINDTTYKSVKTIVQYLVNAAGHNANFLLNVGPMPNGKIQPEFVDTLKKVGQWMDKYGESIYGTRGNVIAAPEWGTATFKNNIIYVHILKPTNQPLLFIPGIKNKVLKATMFDGEVAIKTKQQPEGVFIYLPKFPEQNTDTIIKLTIKN